MPRRAALRRARSAGSCFRFEFRVDHTSGDVRLLEVNLNCNLWSEKLFSRSAVAAGFTHAQLIETIVAESMIRQIAPAAARRDAA